ncbi:hypothetical protein DQ04_00481010 [Trypanosoma grayi]|uniref:hypothetical protein n=1 Tax=Trypanosoma grayi TaxID=71804 RepID=UPI0004F43AC4|nr:hypothetical protein DQ04_00481010 [Trypanosoma grayi]KEG14406.1 hypothetical protein DQ04_00481010 [Trypanosoma grayi]
MLANYGHSTTVRINTVMPLRRNSRSATLEDDEPEVAGIEVDRLSFMNTALRALPGNTLRTFFAPVMNIKSVFFRRRRLTERYASSDPAKLEKAFREAIRILTKALVDASLELFEVPVPLDEKELAAELRGKLTPICYEPGAVLVYPGEFPESMFVHVVLSGNVQVVSFQPQSRKGIIADSSKRQYFVNNDTIRLAGSLGLNPELLRFATTPAEPTSDGASDVASISNLSTAIQRSLRRASRMIGQPTLLPARTELFRAPYVCCAAEALGLEPFRLATITAEATAPSARTDMGNDMRVTETMRIRTTDLHNVLIKLASAQMGGGRVPLFTGGATRHPTTVADYITAARVRSISSYYPLNEILMRQSWLLQDTPAHTIRALATQLTPRSYLPGEVILCPHTTSRQLCFLRRGTMTIEEPPAATSSDACACQCLGLPQKRKVLQEVPVGASFGELSVLFGEPRHFVLRAQTSCDVWCLSHHGFAATVRRDDALRGSLLTKAAALRMRWLGEQRFTESLAQKLRESCELFRDASDSFIRLVQERIEPVVYPPGTLLTSTSSRCGEMLIILHGKVTSIVDGVVEYGPGSVIGEPVIILHRWPLGLVSKAMVEGWKLSRNNLRDALYRIEVLRRHSGEVGAHAPQMMQRVFAPPVPQCDVDAVGRSRMPLVGPPPRGETYMEYALWLAEVQLKALCFRYRDYVKWDDISYTTLPGERKMQSMSAAAMEAKIFAGSDEVLLAVQPVGSGANAARGGKKSDATKKKKKGKPKVIAGSTFPFYVNAAIAHQPFTKPALRKPPPVISDEEDPFLAKQRALTAAWKAQPQVKTMPELERLVGLVDSRDKMQKVESKQNPLSDTQQERMGLIEVTRAGGPAPVHIFLQGPNPRIQITVEEAISVGYVLQFPDTKRIQSCVSNIDSDVTMGLPQHRQRRRDMALAPNERHHRRCFLFAASHLGEKSTEEMLVRDTATQEADTREKAQHLTTLLLARLTEKRRQSGMPNSTGIGGDFNVSGEWRRGSGLKSMSRGLVTSSLQSTPSREVTYSLQETGEQAFLQELKDNPEKAMNSMRVRFQVPHDVAEGESLESKAGRPSSENSGSRSELFERLRRISLAKDPNAVESSSSGPPPRRPSLNVDDKEPGESVDAPENALATFFKQDDAPLFIDNYGQLGVPHNKATMEVQAFQSASDALVSEELQFCGTPDTMSGREHLSISAWIPSKFVMPSVSEATATMRRIQRDVDGLNAVAEEQRRERLLGRRRRTDNTSEPFTDSTMLAEYHRRVEGWTNTYRENARDPLCSARIPSMLMAEAGTDYLAEEFRLTRHQQVETTRGGHGVEIWRGEMCAGERRNGKPGSGADMWPGKNVQGAAAKKKFGQPSKPLQNPTSHMNHEEYQRWTAKRDAVFAAATPQR